MQVRQRIRTVGPEPDDYGMVQTFEWLGCPVLRWLTQSLTLCCFCVGDSVDLATFAPRQSQESVDFVQTS